MPESLDIKIPATVGRKPNAMRHATAIQAAENRFADRLPEIADMMLELALGRKPERCPVHKGVLRCLSTDGEDCDYESRGSPNNQRALEYVLNRIAGTPTAITDKHIQMDFVRKVTRHVAEVFKAANVLASEEERARNFAIGIATLWTVIGNED